MSETKHILMIGGQMPTEALRMASGLTHRVIRRLMSAS